MPSTTFIAQTAEAGIVSRSSSTRSYAFAVIVSDSINPRTWEGASQAGAWGWSGDRTNAEKMAQQARKVYRKVEVVPALRIQRTEPAFANGSPELAWHTVDSMGSVKRYGRSKAELMGR